jgi:hypothetical protein
METELIAVAPVSGTSHRPLPAPPPWVCGVLIAAAKTALKTVGLRRALRWINAQAEGVSPSDGVDPVVVGTVEQAVAMAAALYPGRALCLEQSLVLYYCLRRRHIAATFRIGIQAYPFAAHAWVEYRGRPINDVAEHVKWFVPLPELPP